MYIKSINIKGTPSVKFIENKFFYISLGYTFKNNLPIFYSDTSHIFGVTAYKSVVAQFY